MPKYDIILIKRKIKTIRASSKDVARKRAEAMEKSDWMIEAIEDSAMGIEITE
jgi:hypothetical protein